MTFPENERVGSRLERARIQMGKGCYEMSCILGISEGHYRKIERGIYGLDVRKLLALYRRVGIDPMYLLIGLDSEESLLKEPENLSERISRICRLLMFCMEELSEMEAMLP